MNSKLQKFAPYFMVFLPFSSINTGFLILVPPTKASSGTGSPPIFLTYENVTSDFPTPISTKFVGTANALYYLSGNTLWKSTDGTTFSSLSVINYTRYGNPTQFYVTKNGVILVATSKDPSYYLITSHDNGATWQVGLNSTFHLAWWQPTSPDDYGNLIFLGVYTALPKINPLIYCSIDNGVSWSLRANLTDMGILTQHIHTVIYDPINNDLLITYGDNPANTVIAYSLATNKSTTLFTGLFTAKAVVENKAYFWGEGIYLGEEIVGVYNFATKIGTILHMNEGTMVQELFYGFEQNDAGMVFTSTWRPTNPNNTGIYLLCNNTFFTLIKNTSPTYGYFWITAFKGWLYIHFNDGSPSVMRLRMPLVSEIPKLKDANPIVTPLGVSSTNANSYAIFSANFSSNIGLSNYIFSTDINGVWINDTAITFIANPQVVTVTKMLPLTSGTMIQWKWYCNDSSNNWATSDIQDLTVTRNPTPTNTISPETSAPSPIPPKTTPFNTPTSTVITHTPTPSPTSLLPASSNSSIRTKPANNTGIYFVSTVAATILVAITVFVLIKVSKKKK
jgi:hypothetical protein